MGMRSAQPQQKELIFEKNNYKRWKLIVYNNVKRKWSWGKRNELLLIIPKACLPPKVILYIYCDWKGIVYYELLLQNQTLNSNMHLFSQLDRLKIAIDENIPGIGWSEVCPILSEQCQTWHRFSDLAEISKTWLGCPFIISVLT